MILDERAKQIIRQALAEDIGSGDATTEVLVPANATGRAVIVAKESGVVAGLPFVREAFLQVSAAVKFSSLVQDGQMVARSDRLAEIAGPMRAILTAERTALNFLQRLSGIATMTRRCVEAVRGTGVQILDTRKTTPCLRALEKYAVRCGGGSNHRFGLYDQVLIKDNHLRTLLPVAGSLPRAVALAVRLARGHVGERMLIEVETESLEMVRTAIESGADIIMLDNMPLDEMRAAAGLVRSLREKTGASRPKTEASGGVTLENLPLIAATGVDAISIGALTHSAQALDMALDLI